MAKVRTDETGKRFNHLEVLGFFETLPQEPTRYRVRCDCGALTDVRRDNLVSGHTSSCSCRMAPNLQGKKSRPRGPAKKHAPAERSEARVCETCRAPFLATKQEVKRGWARFCSRKCRGASRMVPSDAATGRGPVFDIRKASGATQKQFAVKVGLSKSLIEKCERGNKWPELSEAKRKIEEFARTVGYKFRCD